ncbi:hypothetical protein J8J40_33430, partial [Mycobacterium tuberculosis]|nr:hypothetical protein [Mycobacterium tuberculosis]
ITRGNAATAGGINFGAGNDTLGFTAAGGTVSVSNVETVTGAGGTDVAQLTTQATALTVDMGAGDDKLVLGDFVNTATVSNT